MANYYMPPFKSNTYSDYIIIARSILGNRKCQKIDILIHAENWGRCESVFIPTRLNFEPNPSHTHKGARGRDVSVCLILVCGFSVWLDRARGGWNRMVVLAAAAEQPGAIARCPGFVFLQHSSCQGCENPKKKIHGLADSSLQTVT